MTGLAQILDENKRLREELEAQKALTEQFETQAQQFQTQAQQFQAQAQQHRHRAARLAAQLAVVTERAEYLEKVLALQKWKQEHGKDQDYLRSRLLPCTRG